MVTCLPVIESSWLYIASTRAAPLIARAEANHFFAIILPSALLSRSHDPEMLTADALGPVFTLALSCRRHFCLRSLRGFGLVFWCSVRTRGVLTKIETYIARETKQQQTIQMVITV